MNRRVFHEAVPQRETKRGKQQRGLIAWLRVIALFPFRVLASPFRLYVRVRHSMTAASVTVLLICIVSLNIVWGYPWSGMFAACLSLLLVGRITNWLTRPRLEIGFSLPRSTPAGQPFAVVTHAKNVGYLPAMTLRIGFKAPRKRRANAEAGFSLREPHAVSLIQPGQRIHRSGSVQFDRRGVQVLPDLIVTSTFPFHLFRSSQQFQTFTSIAVTPKLMVGDEDDLTRTLLNALGNWSHRLLAGDALDYTGSREYEVGMAVRRWDFSSWARLGRPIVREFQSPTIQMVTLVVDTACDKGQDPSQIERVLSLAATAVTDLTRKSVRVGLFIPHAESSNTQFSEAGFSTGDSESLLIRMADAQLVEPAESNRQIERVVGQMRHTPLLILTTRKEIAIDAKASQVTVLRIDPAEEEPPRQKSSRTHPSTESQQSATNQRLDAGTINKPNHDVASVGEGAA